MTWFPGCIRLRSITSKLVGVALMMAQLPGLPTPETCWMAISRWLIVLTYFRRPNVSRVTLIFHLGVYEEVFFAAAFFSARSQTTCIVHKGHAFRLRGRPRDEG